MNPPPNFPATALFTLLLVSAGCMVGPHYKQPSAAGIQRAAARELQGSGSGWLEAIAARRRILERPMVGTVQRCGPECAGRASERFEPECAASGGAVPASQGCGQRGPRRVVANQIGRAHV